jgi:voltage-gated potassium channel
VLAPRRRCVGVVSPDATQCAAFNQTNVLAMHPEPKLQRWEKSTEWPLAAIAGVFLGAYSVQVLAQTHGYSETVLRTVIQIAWAVFVADYVARLILATNRPRWFVRHLLDLAVVALPFLRPLRLLRLLVLVGALQKAVGEAIRGRIIIYTVFSVVLLVYVASLAILQTERSQPGTKISTFGDAVWWSICTVTTVGYGDLAPVTGVGRVIAVMLMIGGISLVGVVTATLASWVIQRVAEEDTAHQSATAAEIDALRADVEQRMDTLSAEIQLLTDAVTPQQSPEDRGRGFSGAVSKVEEDSAVPVQLE